MVKTEIIESLVKNFVVKSKRDRCLFELLSPKKRHKFAERLNHDWEETFNVNLFQPTPKAVHDYKVLIDKIPIKKNQDCYLISNIEAFDDQIVKFEKAFLECCNTGSGTLIFDFTNKTVFIEEEPYMGAPGRFIGKVK